MVLSLLLKVADHSTDFELCLLIGRAGLAKNLWLWMIGRLAEDRLGII